ncbi:MAG: hypothetical protein C0602_09220 [Denitrovibrio sp.]|nr:MAG: hypothetical protein C0602_09220 [Denitrovibrio sp.]
MKKRHFIVIFVIVAVFAGGLYYTFTDASYDHYNRALELYNEGKYREANEQLEIGLRKNNLNRKIIALKGKVYPIVQGEQDYEEAEKLYQESINLALEGKIPAAKLAMSRAYELVSKVTTSSLVYEEAQELIRKIERDSSLVLEGATESLIKRATKHEAQGDLIRAFETLNNIEIKNEKVKRKMSDIAFRLGERRYRSFKGQSVVEETYVQDAIYWFSQVQPFDDKYLAANNRISELKLITTK